ncbi:hypothetical protein AB0L05_38695, partial [Nonomuraea pusilla]
MSLPKSPAWGAPILAACAPLVLRRRLPLTAVVASAMVMLALGLALERDAGIWVLDLISPRRPTTATGCARHSCSLRPSFAIADSPNESRSKTVSYVVSRTLGGHGKERVGVDRPGRALGDRP